MYHTKPPPHADSYTPAGYARYEALHKNYLRAIHARDATPIQVIAAAFDWRQGANIDMRLEGLPGEARTYHLQTLSGTMAQVAEQMHPDCIELAGIPTRKRARLTLHFLAHLHGWRWSIGVGGLREALEGIGAPSVVLNQFDAERQAFDQRFTALLQAAHLVNERSENPKAVEQCISLMLAELHSLCDWMAAHPTRESFHAKGNRLALHRAQRILEKTSHEAPATPKRKRRVKRNGWA